MFNAAGHAPCRYSLTVGNPVKPAGSFWGGFEVEVPGWGFVPSDSDGSDEYEHDSDEYEHDSDEYEQVRCIELIWSFRRSTGRLGGPGHVSKAITIFSRTFLFSQPASSVGKQGHAVSEPMRFKRSVVMMCSYKEFSTNLQEDWSHWEPRPLNLPRAMSQDSSSRFVGWKVKVDNTGSWDEGQFQVEFDPTYTPL
eukprot:1159050-Pelagomonas_calceolata.AAC.1